MLLLASPYGHSDLRWSDQLQRHLHSFEQKGLATLWNNLSLQDWRQVALVTTEPTFRVPLTHMVAHADTSQASPSFHSAH